MKRANTWDSEDEMFEYSLEFLNEIRQPVYTKCIQLLSHFKEMARQIGPLHLQFDLISASLLHCEQKLGARAPATEEMEALLTAFLEVKLIFEKVGIRIGLLEQFCVCTLEKQRMNELQAKFDYLWEKRRTLVQSEIDELRSAVSIPYILNHAILFYIHIALHSTFHLFSE